MTHCCSQCSFKANFESALQMHRQLHHGAQAHLPDVEDYINMTTPSVTKNKCKTLPVFDHDVNPLEDYCGIKPVRKGLMRSPSASRLFGKLRATISRSKMLFSHSEENRSTGMNANETAGRTGPKCGIGLSPKGGLTRADDEGDEGAVAQCDCVVGSITQDMSANSSCTSKALKEESSHFRCSAITANLEDAARETFACHLCSFDADRITVLDRHLLTHHKIGLDNLLQLVMNKTKEGLHEDSSPRQKKFGIREPYYKPAEDVLEEGEFVIETVMPKIKILKHASTNTDIQWSEIPDLRDNCRMITKELDKLMSNPINKTDQQEMMEKMQTLNDYMCKFVNSSNMLKNVLNKEFVSPRESKERRLDEPMFDLGLGDPGTSRDWGRAHSEKLERNRNKHEDSRGEKSKLSSESYYF